MLPQLSQQTGAGWECLLGSGNQSSYLVLKPPAALSQPSLHSDFPTGDSQREQAAGDRPALKVGAKELGYRPGGLGAHRQPPGSTFSRNLGAAATEHLAPAIRRSFPRRRTQPPGDPEPCAEGCKGNVGGLSLPATLSLAPLCSSATSGVGVGGRDRVLVTPLAQASARRLLGTRCGRRHGTDRSALRRAPHMPLRWPSTGLGR